MGLFGGDGGGTYVQPNEFLQYPQYSYTEPRIRLTSDFVSDNIQNMAEGNFPSYYQKAYPKLRENLSRQNYQTYFGRPGQRTGAVQGAMEAGAMTGIGPKATNFQVNKQLQDYADKETAIDEYLTKLGVDITSSASVQFPQLSNQIPQGPQGQVVQGRVVNTGKADSPWTALASIFGSGAAKSGVDLLKNIFNKDTTTNYGSLPALVNNPTISNILRSTVRDPSMLDMTYASQGIDYSGGTPSTFTNPLTTNLWNNSGLAGNWSIA
jgi:hypothetical protein